MSEDTAALHEEEITEAVRSACLEAARAAYEDARLRGLCAEGAWETALGAIESVDVDAVIRREKS